MQVPASKWRVVAALTVILAVALGLCGAVVWGMTTTESFGPLGHFTQSVQHPIYPRRAEALWALGMMSAAVALLASVMQRRRT